MLIHFVACWFFIYAFQELAALHDIALTNALTNIKNVDDDKMLNVMKHFDPNRIAIEAAWINLSGPLGLMTGFIASLLISLKNKWYWLNSVIVFVVMIFFKRFKLLGWYYLKNIILEPSDLFKSMTARFLTNGLIMLAIGLSLFFVKWSIMFINGNTGRTDE
jgi:hypothetical protein